MDVHSVTVPSRFWSVKIESIREHTHKNLIYVVVVKLSRIDLAENSSRSPVRVGHTESGPPTVDAAAVALRRARLDRHIATRPPASIELRLWTWRGVQGGYAW